MSSASKKKAVLPTAIDAIIKPNEDNQDLSESVYIAKKGILHNGKLFISGDVLTGFPKEALDRLVKLKAAEEKKDEFPKFN